MYENNNQDFNNNNFNPNQNVNNMGYMPSGMQQDNINNFNSNIGFDSQTNEIPPILDPIKPLNESQNVSAPTMDALGPMNVMPESLPVQNSAPIDSNYNNMGTSVNPMQTQQVDNYQSPTPTMPQVDTYPQQNNNYNPPTSPQNLNMMGSFDNGLNQYNNSTSFNQSQQFNNVSISEQQQQYNQITPTAPPTMQQFIPPTNNNFGANGLGQTAQPEINSDSVNSSPMSYNPPSDSPNNFIQPTTLTNNNIESAINQVNELENNSIEAQEAPTTSDVKEEVASENDDMKVVEPEMENNVEIDDTSLQDDKDEITDLGLDSSYTEPDTLEIMDLDSPTESNNSEQIEPTGLELKQQIEKIKNLVKEIEDSGYKVSIEEFDFEEMYQINLKINK